LRGLNRADAPCFPHVIDDERVGFKQVTLKLSEGPLLLRKRRIADEIRIGGLVEPQASLTMRTAQFLNRKLRQPAFNLAAVLNRPPPEPLQLPRYFLCHVAIQRRQLRRHAGSGLRTSLRAGPGSPSPKKLLKFRRGDAGEVLKLRATEFRSG